MELINKSLYNVEKFNENVANKSHALYTQNVGNVLRAFPLFSFFAIVTNVLTCFSKVYGK